MIHCIHVFESFARVARRTGEHLKPGMIDKSISASKTRNDLASVALEGHLMHFSRAIDDSEIPRAAFRANKIVHTI